MSNFILATNIESPEPKTCNGCRVGTAVVDIMFKQHVVSLCEDCAEDVQVQLQECEEARQ